MTRLANVSPRSRHERWQRELPEISAISVAGHKTRIVPALIFSRLKMSLTVYPERLAAPFIVPFVLGTLLALSLFWLLMVLEALSQRPVRVRGKVDTTAKKKLSRCRSLPDRRARHPINRVYNRIILTTHQFLTINCNYSIQTFIRLLTEFQTHFGQESANNV